MVRQRMGLFVPRCRSGQLHSPKRIIRSMTARILVLDDDAVACEFLQEALLRAGYEVDAHTSAEKVLKLDLSGYDLLISDIKMPVIDGLYFLRHVQDKWPDIPVILVTAYGSLETTMDALRMGAWDYISKPFTPAASRTTKRRLSSSALPP